MFRKIVFLFSMTLTIGMTASAFAVPYSDNVMNGIYTSDPEPGKITPRTNESPFQYDLYQAVNRLAGTTYNDNDDINSLYLTNPSVWRSGILKDVTVAVIGYSALRPNTLNYYLQQTPQFINPLVPLPASSLGWAGDGTASAPYEGAIISRSSIGQLQFGFSLTSDSYVNDAQKRTYYSQSSLNADKYDHLMVYNMSMLSGTTLFIEDESTGTTYLHKFGNLTYLMGWEDKPFATSTGTLGDDDYNDLMFLVDLNGSNSLRGRDYPPSVPEPGTISLVLAGIGGLWLLRRRRF